jgi:hypothetical protein
MAKEKKWYEHFVTIESSAESAAEETSGGDSNAAQAVADIAASIQPSALQAQVEKSIEAAPRTGVKPLSFEEIYKAAEILPPTHGYTVMKVADMLENPLIKELPAEVKRSSVLVALQAASVKVQEVIEDAVRRDKALDAFERIQHKQIEELEATKLDENRKLQTELDKLTAEYKPKIQANNDSVAQSKESFYSWRLDKQKLEQRIADTVSHFVSENPITTSASLRTPPPAPKAGI